MRVATIGSGFIVDRMIQTVHEVNGLELYCVYSRTEQKAKSFAEKHNVSVYYTDLIEMLNDPLVDIVYVASPNSLHYSQSKLALEHGKHVLCEKPFVPNIKECKELFDIAHKNNVYILEAITNIHLPNYHIVKENLNRVGQLKMVQCNFSQYSSRYLKYKNHEQTNAFDPSFNGGALMDINVYNIHFVVGIFGKPLSVHYFKNSGYNGVDTSGILIMEYKDFLVECTGAKDSASPNSIYLQGDEGTLIVTGISNGVLEHVHFSGPKKDLIGKKDTDDKENLGLDQGNHMIYECKDFVEILQGKNQDLYEYCCQETKNVVEILSQFQN